MEKHKCDECGEEFTSISEFETHPEDICYVIEQKTCDIVGGDYLEWWEIRCPICSNVVQEYGR